MLPPKCRVTEGPVDPAARQAWSWAVDNYVERCTRNGGSWNQLIEIPALHALLGDVAGKRTLEVGCGPAHYSIWLAQRGAEAWGLDPAARMVEVAQEDAKSAGVELNLRVGGVELLPEYPPDHFDIVLFPMMIEYVDDPTAAFRQAHHVLKPEGFVAISMVHPMRAWGSNHVTEDGEELRLVSHYLERSIIEWSGWIFDDDEEGNEVRCKSHRRPIEDYVDALAGAGFLIEALREPAAAPESWTIDPDRCRSNSNCPQFLLLKAVRDPRCS